MIAFLLVVLRCLYLPRHQLAYRMSLPLIVTSSYVYSYCKILKTVLAETLC